MRLRMSLAVLLSTVFVINASVCADQATTDKQPNLDTVHTLQELLNLATKREKEIRKTVKDYTCVIVKRERIDGILQENRFIEAKVRPAGVHNGKSVPLSVHLHFRAPKTAAGRSVVYVDGQNDGQMVVRRGGKRLSNVIVRVDPDSDAARSETLMHIGHLGFDAMVSEIVAQIRKDIKADPTGSNTELKILRNSKINGRPCTHVQIKHPKQSEGLLYHLAEFFVDDEYHLPVRVAAYGWPKTEGAKPQLLGEFTYTKVKINVGLSDADFKPDWIRTASR